MREIKDKVLRKKTVNMGYALTEATFNYYHGEIRRTNIEASNWIDNIHREKWARAFDEGQRWGYMTSNLAEAINFVLKATKNLPITALVHSTYYRMGSLFGKRGHKWTKMLATWKVFTDGCNKGMTDEVAKANTHNVMQFDRERFCFMVQEKINQNDDPPTDTFNVDLRNRCCDCGKFQAFHLPCSHVIATCSSIRKTTQFTFQRSSQYLTYSKYTKKASCDYRTRRTGQNMNVLLYATTIPLEEIKRDVQPVVELELRWTTLKKKREGVRFAEK
ncbi:unnamed protein product [Lathyrus sativus]|nr:unnamed protein product [Lathyrus sativus]